MNGQLILNNARAALLPQSWFSNIYKDLLSGVVVALALIPEAIAFSVIAGVDPKVGLYGAFSIAIVIAFVGGRPGMISAATGSMALLMTTLVRDHGLAYLLAATVLTGVLQMIWGAIKLGNQMRFVPRSVMAGFVNALGLLIFNAQIGQLAGGSWLVYVFFAVGLGIIYGLPRLTQAVPSALVAILVLTGVAIAAGLDLPTVGDMGQLPTQLPGLALPQVPLSFETLEIVLPYALALSIVGLMESFLTASVLDDMTDTSSNKNHEAVGQGIANIATGFLGGMAGCALIGQSIINIRSGGRTRLSTLSAGVFLLLFILVLDSWVARIPMAVLTAVMVMVSFSTFSWQSVRRIRQIPRNETAVMLTTVAATLLTHNLAIGVLVGIALSTTFFSQRIARLVRISSTSSADGYTRVYSVSGQLFFVSVPDFLQAFNRHEVLTEMVLDLSEAHLWDQTAVDAVDKIVLGFRRRGIDVKVIGLNVASATLINRLAIYNQPRAVGKSPSH